jgi:hypothetical protein
MLRHAYWLIHDQKGNYQCGLLHILMLQMSTLWQVPSENIILQHYNASSHSVHLTSEKTEVWLGSAPPSFSQSELGIFRLLFVQDMKITWGASIMEMIRQSNKQSIVLWSTETYFYLSGIFKLMKCWQKYLNRSGNFMEEW